MTIGRIRIIIVNLPLRGWRGARRPASTLREILAKGKKKTTKSHTTTAKGNRTYQYDYLESVDRSTPSSTYSTHASGIR